LNKPFYILFFVFLSFNIRAQINLVSNPSFEDIDSCYGQPAAIGFDVFNWSGCNNWNCPTDGSSDLWCENPIIGTINPPFISAVGYQYPRTGENMAGMVMFDIVYPNYREYIQNKLISSLINGKYYQFSFYVNTVDNEYNATSCIQAYFSQSIVSQTTWLPLAVIPQIQNDASHFIIDTLGWEKISGIYKAQGGEQYVTIGCFNDSLNIIVRDTSTTTGSGIYFFADDVALEELPAEINIPNVFSPNQDGINDLFIPTIKNIENWEVTIYNRWGESVAKIDSAKTSWNGRDNVDGVYYYIFEGKIKDQLIKEKGFVQLVR
jgi:gliding motility-associated-like protein